MILVLVILYVEGKKRATENSKPLQLVSRDLYKQKEESTLKNRTGSKSHGLSNRGCEY